MERKEPTLSGLSGEREEPLSRRNAPYDESRPTRSPSVQHASPSASPLPAIALTIALLAVAAAALLGWQLMEAQAMLAKDSARIAQLESQLNVTSSESTQSVTALGINLQKLDNKVDAEVKKLSDATKKTGAEFTERTNGLAKAIETTKVEIGSLKGDVTTMKQDLLANRASLDEIPPRIDAIDKNIAEQRKKIQDTSASLSAMLSQVKSAEGLASRITKTEEAIDAIDDNRRTINRDLLQIKQQLGIKN